MSCWCRVRADVLDTARRMALYVAAVGLLTVLMVLSVKAEASDVVERRWGDRLTVREWPLGDRSTIEPWVGERLRIRSWPLEPRKEERRPLLPNRWSKRT